MFSLIGSGRYVTAPIITDTGEPTQDPIAISQIYGKPELASLTLDHKLITNNYVNNLHYRYQHEDICMLSTFS